MSFFQSLTANLAPESAVRYEMLEGKKYLVAPVVMITEGVFAGNNGPILYKEEELAKTPQVWNMKPIVVYHPLIGNKHVSACDPEVIERQRVGMIMNATWDSEAKKLRAEAWIDPDKADDVDERIMQSVLSGNIMEVSTGLFIDMEKEEGTFNGREYTGVARNFRPDHLALLPDSVGACSVADGAGLLQVNQVNKDGIIDKAAELAGKIGFPLFVRSVQNALSFRDVGNRLIELAREKFANKDTSVFLADVFNDFFVVEIEEVGKGTARFVKLDYEKKGDELKIVGIPVDVVPFRGYKTLDGEVVTNSPMKTEGGMKYPAEAYAYVPDPNKPSTWKLRLWETPEKKVTAAQVGRAVAALGKGYRGKKVQIPSKDLPSVKAKVRAAWKKANPKKKPSEMPSVIRNEKGAKGMDKEKLIDSLISNEQTKWQEEDREFLSTLEEDQLEKMIPVAVENKEEGSESKEGKEPKEDPVANEGGDGKPASVDEYIANAPKEMQDVLRAGVESYRKEKAELVKKIVANERNVFTKEALEEKPLEELRAIAKLAANATADFSAAEPAAVANSGEGGEEVLELPTFESAN